jgi:hypothetical protein
MRTPSLVAALLCAGCAATGHAPGAPVPADEPRAALHLRVDLARAQDCEETFDLALYQSPAVDLVAWDGAAGRCEGREVTIRYLPRRASREEILRAASALAARVTALEETTR